MASKYLKKYRVPEGFEELITELSKEVLKNQPIDIIDFAVEYFKCLQEGIVLDYDKKGNKLPYDFEPEIPRIPWLKKSYSICEGNQEKYLTSIGNANKSYKSNKGKTTDGFFKKRKAKKPKEETKKEPEPVKTEPSNERSSDKRKTWKKDSNKDLEEPKEYKAPILNTEPIKEEPTLEALHIAKKKEIFGNKLSFIDLNDKETLLNELKERNEEEIEKYKNEVYIPNKPYTDLIIQIQKAIIFFYERKYIAGSNEELMSSYQEIIDSLAPYPEIDNFIKTYQSQSVKIANDSFKLFNYYQQMLICYIAKLSSLVEDNIEIIPFLNEFCFFLLNQNIKDLLEESVRKLKNYPWLNKFFKNTIIFLQPELYELYQTNNINTQDDNYIYYTQFSIKSREMFTNCYLILSLDIPKKQVNKEIDMYERWYYSTSLDQINNKLLSGKGEFGIEECEALAKKIQTSSKKIWELLTGILNNPIEVLDEFVWRFKAFYPLEQDIIMNFINLREDYIEINEKFAEIPRTSDEIKYLILIKKINLYSMIEVKDDLEKKIIKYELRRFESLISDNIKETMRELLSSHKASEEVIATRFGRLNSIERDIIYHLLISKLQENSKIGSIIEKIKFIQSINLIDNFTLRVEFLNEYFTRDSLEYDTVIEEITQWKKMFPIHLKELFEQDISQQLSLFKHKLNNKEKKFALKMFQLQKLIKEDEDEELDQLIEKAKASINDLTYEEYIDIKKKRIIEKKKHVSNHKIGMSVPLIYYLINELNDNERLRYFSLLNQKEKEMVIDTIEYRIDDEEINYTIGSELSDHKDDPDNDNDDFYFEHNQMVQTMNAIISNQTVNSNVLIKLKDKMKDFAPEVICLIDEINNDDLCPKEKQDEIIMKFIGFLPIFRELVLKTLTMIVSSESNVKYKKYLEVLEEYSDDFIQAKQDEIKESLEYDLSSIELKKELLRNSSFDLVFLYEFILSYPAMKQEIEFCVNLFSHLSVNKRNILLTIMKSDINQSNDSNTQAYIEVLEPLLNDQVTVMPYYTNLILSMGFHISFLSNNQSTLVLNIYRLFKNRNNDLVDYVKSLLSDSSIVIEKMPTSVQILVNQIQDLIDILLE